MLIHLIKITFCKKLPGNRMEVYSDSLYMQNQLLNHKLYDFVPLFDNQIQQSFSKLNKEITKTRKKSIIYNRDNCCSFPFYYFFHNSP